ncbi:nucleotidyltransferase domain-containing protein [Lactococcus lactis]|uniref:nucleotidyltransferase domain-containing protein n=1 Tax=Lactococcus lactis TaxID=1358 RepID=UPI003392FB20
MKNIISVYEFGSYNTEEKNKFSDLDIFVLYKKRIKFKEKKEIEEKIKQNYGNIKQDISYYEFKTFKTMLNEGSLLLEHIRKDGKNIYGKNLDNEFKGLNTYEYYQESYYVYLKIFLRIKNEIENSKGTSYDWNIVGVLLRNLFILISCKDGESKFGKLSSFHDVVYQYKEFNKYAQIYEDLLKARIYYKTGEGDINNLVLKYINENYLKYVSDIFYEVERKLKFDTDLKKYIQIEFNPKFHIRYTEFENSVYLERGIYVTICNYLKKNSISRKFIEDSKEQVCLDGMSLLKMSKTFKKISSNYEDIDNDITIYEKHNEVQLDILQIKDKIIKYGLHFLRFSKEILLKINAKSLNKLNNKLSKTLYLEHKDLKTQIETKTIEDYYQEYVISYCEIYSKNNP